MGGEVSNNASERENLGSSRRSCSPGSTSDTGSDYGKRRARRSVLCRECRSRKIRCDGSWPICNNGYRSTTSDIERNGESNASIISDGRNATPSNDHKSIAQLSARFINHLYSIPPTRRDLIDISPSRAPAYVSPEKRADGVYEREERAVFTRSANSTTGPEWGRTKDRGFGGGGGLGTYNSRSHGHQHSTYLSDRHSERRDEVYIRRPENAFILFRRKCCEDRTAQEEAATDGPTKKQRQADLSKTISQQWKSLSMEERQNWENLAKEKKKEHEQMYPNYVYRPQRTKDGRSRSRRLSTSETESDMTEATERPPGSLRSSRSIPTIDTDNNSSIMSGGKSVTSYNGFGGAPSIVPSGQFFANHSVGGATRESAFETRTWDSETSSPGGARRAFLSWENPYKKTTKNGTGASETAYTDAIFSHFPWTSASSAPSGQPPRRPLNISGASYPGYNVREATGHTPSPILRSSGPYAIPHSRYATSVGLPPGRPAQPNDTSPPELNHGATQQRIVTTHDPSIPRAAFLRAKVATVFSNISQGVLLGVPALYARHAFHLRDKHEGGLDKFFDSRIEDCKAILALDSALLGVISANFGYINKTSAASSVIFLSPACLMVSAAHSIALMLFLNSIKSDGTLLNHLPDERGNQWFPWVVLSMPAVWTSWGVISFLISMFILTWSTDAKPTAGSAIQLGRFPMPVVVTTVVLGVGTVCLLAMLVTLRRRLFANDRMSV